jgi:hypothetical protein
MENPQDPQTPVTPPEAKTETPNAGRDWEKEAKDNAKEAQALRQRLKEAEGKVSEAESAKLTEAEKLAKDAKDKDEKLTALEVRVINSELKVAASDFGFHDVADAIRLIDRSEIKTENGEITNAKELMAALAKAKPWLIKGAVAPPSGRQPAGGGDQVQDKKREEELRKRFRI